MKGMRSMIVLETFCLIDSRLYCAHCQNCKSCKSWREPDLVACDEEGQQIAHDTIFLKSVSERKMAED